MNRSEFIKRVSNVLRKNDIKKHVHLPKQVFHISDDDGNTKDFSVKKTDKTIIYTNNDVASIIDACLYVIQEALKSGDTVTISGFGRFGLLYRKERKTKSIGTNEEICIEGHYIPKFYFGKDLRRCAKLYELSRQDASDSRKEALRDEPPFMNYEGTEEEELSDYGD